MKLTSLRYFAIAATVAVAFAAAAQAQEVTVTTSVPLTELEPPAPVAPPIAPATPAPPATYAPMQPLQGLMAYTLDGYDGGDSESQIKTLEAQIKELDEQIASGKDEKKSAALKRERERLTRRIERARRILPLQKNVDVKFENATVAQAVEALSQASGVKITAESAIPEETRLTVVARRVRLARVLESIARQAGLIIEPEGLEAAEAPLGVILTAPPVLRVNDSEETFPKPLSPWSDKWGTPPTNRFIFTQNLPGASVWTANPGFRYEINSTVRAAMDQAKEAQRMASVYSGQAARMSVGRAIIVSGTGARIEADKKGTVTVMESGKNDKGEKGSWRTVYTIKNGELIKQSRSFTRD